MKIPVTVWSEVKTQEGLNLVHNMWFDSVRLGKPIPSLAFKRDGNKIYVVTTI